MERLPLACGGNAVNSFEDLTEDDLGYADKVWEESLGDDKYTFEKSLKTKNKELMLHSYKIKFIINNKKYTFKALLPSYFKKLIKTKRLNFSNY